MSLQVRGLIRDERIGDRVRLVEAVTGEGLDQGPEILGLLFGRPVLDGAAKELLRLGLHDLPFLLADRLAQQVRLRQRVARHPLRDPHHLLLIDEDPQRLLEDRLQLGQGVAHARGAVSPAHVFLDGSGVQRARPVKGVQSSEVREDARLGAAKKVAHPARVELKDTGRLSGPEELEGLLVIEREMVHVQRDAMTLLHTGDGRIEDVERDQAEEVDLQETHLLDGVHVELGRDFVLVRSVEREVIHDGARRDNDSRGVHTGVARQPLQALGDLHDSPGRLVGVQQFLQAGRFLQRSLEIDIGPVGHELGDPVAQRNRQRQHPRHVPHGELGLQLGEGHDLRDVFPAVLARDVLDDLPSPLLTEIDVDIRHRDALGVQEPLEKQVELQRADLGDPESPRDDRSGGTAPARSHRDSLFPRVPDEVRDDQEVRRKSHLLDHRALVGQPLAVLLERNAGGRSFLGQSPLQAGGRELTEVLRRRLAGRRGESRQVKTLGVEGDGASLRNGDGIGDRLHAPVAEALLHLVGVLDVELIVVETHPPLVFERLAHADAQQDLVSEGVFPLQIVAVIGRDRRSSRFTREPQEIGHDRGLLRQAVVHDLDVEIALSEDVLVLEERFLGCLVIAARESARHLPLEAAGEPDESLCVLPQKRLVHPGPMVETRQIALGHQANEVLVPLLRCREDGQVIGVPLARFARRLRLAVPPVRRRDVGLDSDDRADAVFEGLMVEGERSEHVAVVGDRDGRHRKLRHPPTQLRQPVGTVQERVLAVKVEMNEVGGHEHDCKSSTIERNVAGFESVRREREEVRRSEKVRFFVSRLTSYVFELPPRARPFRRDDGRRRRHHRLRNLHQPASGRAEALFRHGRSRGLDRRRGNRSGRSVCVRGARDPLSPRGRRVRLPA